MAIYEVCFQNGIKLEMEWIPRSQNELADYISRILWWPRGVKQKVKVLG